MPTFEPAQHGKPYTAYIKSVGKARAQYDEPDKTEALIRIVNDEEDE
jgi:hypothetical protein